MANVLEHVAKARKNGDFSALSELGSRGRRVMAHKAALDRANQRRREQDQLNQRIQRLRVLVTTSWVIEDARIAALRSGYDALAD